MSTHRRKEMEKSQQLERGAEFNTHTHTHTHTRQPPRALPFPTLHRYYRFYTDHEDEGYTVSAVGESGDVDLFVSFVEERPSREKGKYLYKAEGASTCAVVDCGPSISLGDAVHIPANDKSFCNQPGHVAGTQCLAYVSVYGATNASFTILHVSSNEPTVELLDGIATPTELPNAGTYAYYTFAVGAEVTSFSLDLSVISGDPDLYVSAGGGNLSAPFPDRSHFEWRSTNSAGETLTVLTSGEKQVYKVEPRSPAPRPLLAPPPDSPPPPLLLSRLSTTSPPLPRREERRPHAFLSPLELITPRINHPSN